MSMYESGLSVQAGDIVQAEVRSGKYVGEVVELHGPRAVVKILAVLKHPDQGDLHRPYDPDAAMFHERRALSFTEKTTVPLSGLKLYGGEVPDYRESLLAAAEAEIVAVDRLRRWCEQSLELLQELQKDYRK